MKTESHTDWRRRSAQIEHMDRPDCPEPQLYRTLQRFRILNRLVTRYPCLLTRGVLRTIRRDPDREYRLADIGAGGCDIDRWLIRQTRREGLHLKIMAIDRDPRVVRYASQANRNYPEIEMVQADAMDTDAWNRPDFVFANHLFHHLSDGLCREFLQRIERAGVKYYIISDILRSRSAALLFALFIAPVSHGSFLLEDGLASIRRGFTSAELAQLIRQADLKQPPVIRTLFPARFVIEKG